MNPTSQFHPYQPPETGHEHTATSGLGGFLKKLGVDPTAMSNIDVRSSVGKARSYANSHPGMVLGGLAAAAIGLGMMRKRRLGY